MSLDGSWAPKLGRLPASQAPALRLSAVLSGTLPAVPLQVDHLSFGGWKMLGNDTHGDCVAVTWANERRVLTRLAGSEVYPPLDEVVALYRTQNPNYPTDDGGMVVQDCLDYLRTEGGPDGVRAVAFAKVDHTDPAEVRAALAIFGLLWVGVSVTKANMEQYRDGQPWDYVANSPSEGGHSVAVGGYDSDDTGPNQTFVTWGTEAAFTDAFWAQQVDEAWVVIWPEHLGTAQFVEGIDQQQLADAFHTLTGGTFPAAPEPQPPVGPVADGADAVLALAAQDWVTHHRHSGQALQVARALRVWLAAKGLTTEPEQHG